MQFYICKEINEYISLYMVYVDIFISIYHDSISVLHLQLTALTIIYISCDLEEEKAWF